MSLNPNINYTIIIEVAKSVGLGHFSRMRKLCSRLNIKPQWIVLGDGSLLPDSFVDTNQVSFIKSHSEIPACLQSVNGIAIIDIYAATISLHKSIRSVFNGPLFYFGLNTVVNEPNTYLINLAEGKGPFPKRIENLPNLFEGWPYFITEREVVKPEFRFTPPLKKVLVVFGGTDAGNLAERSFNFLQEGQFQIEFSIIIPDKDRRQKLESSNQNHNLKLLGSQDEFSDFIKDFDFVITSPGNIYFECFLAGVPFMAICQSEIQEKQFKGFPLLWAKKELENILSNLNKQYNLAIEFLSNFNGPFPGENLPEVLRLLKRK